MAVPLSPAAAGKRSHGAHADGRTLSADCGRCARSASVPARTAAGRRHRAGKASLLRCGAPDARRGPEPAVAAMRLGVDAPDQFAADEDRQGEIAVSAFRLGRIALDAVVKVEQRECALAIPHQRIKRR